MNKKLLDKTTQNFLILAIAILLISAPVFYYASHFLYIYEADEVLVFHKEDFVKKIEADQFTNDDITQWNKYNRNIKIIENIGLTKDSIFSSEYFDKISFEIEPLRVLWAPIEIGDKKYTYTETNNLVVMEDMVISVATLFLLVISSLMIGILYLSKRSAKNLWSAFYDTLNQIQKFEIDKNNQPRFLKTDVVEFSQLNKSLENLINKNVSIFKNQREFIENAAHELQTPLALFQTKIDLLAQSNVTNEQAVILDSLNKDVSRLNRLNKNLLLLSKIENNTYFEVENIELHDYLQKRFEFFSEQAFAKNIQILTHYHDKISISSNPVMLDILINNLFLNAIAHNISNGEINITIAQNTLCFSNTGSSIALDHTKMFNRFSKIGSTTNGNGLGLAIVKKIVEMNHWNIIYRFSDSIHSFTVTF